MVEAVLYIKKFRDREDNYKLHQFDLVQSPLCLECGVRDDVEHSLFVCPLGRGTMLNELKRITWSHVTKPEQIKDEHFGAFIRRVLVAKETRLRKRPGKFGSCSCMSL